MASFFNAIRIVKYFRYLFKFFVKYAFFKRI